MPVDASIPLQVQQFKPLTPADMLSLKDLATRSQLNQVNLQNAQAEQEQTNQLRSVMPSAVDPATGRLTPEGLSRITQIKPQLGLQLTQQQEQLRLQDLAFNQKKLDIAKNVGTSYVTSYDRFLQQTGGNKEQAINLARQATLASIDQMDKDGTLRSMGFDDRTIAGLRNLPDPETTRGYVMSLGGKVPELAPKSKETRTITANGPRGEQGTYQKQQEFDHTTNQWRDIPGSYGPRSITTEAGLANSNVVPSQHADKHGEDYLKTLDTGMASTVKAIAEGRVNIQSLSVRGGHREAILQRVTQYDPSFDAGIAPARFATRKDFTSGPTSKNVTAINTAIGHIGTLDELGEAMKNKDVRALNAIYNRVATETGDPRVNNFNIARDAVGNELMRVFRQVNASEAETREWADKFRAANSPAQLREASKTAAELLQSRIDALNDQWRRGMKTTEGYPDLLSPKSQKVLQKVGGKVTGSGPDIKSLLDKYK